MNSLNNEVVGFLMNYIKTNGLTVGDQLPSTIALAKEFDVTPSKIRTALITLSSIGLIQLRPRAGSFIKAIDISIIERLFSIFVNQGISDESQSLLNVYDCKTMVDTEIFPAAAKVRTEEELYQLSLILRRQQEAIDNLEGFIICDEELHGYVAKITRNPLFVLLIDILQAMLRSDRIKNENYSHETRKEVLKDHEQLFQAIKDQNADLAGEVARKHSNRRKLEIFKSSEILEPLSKHN